ncbi:hypothetical protein D9M70_598180 [compost metagenome]
MLTHGGTISSGLAATWLVSGVYWISCMSSHSNTTDPCETATLRPISNADSSVMAMRPCCMSAIRFAKPARRLSPPDSRAIRAASGLVAAKFAGLIMSTNWRVKKRRFCLSFSPTSAASAIAVSQRELAR